MDTPTSDTTTVNAPQIVLVPFEKIDMSNAADFKQHLSGLIGADAHIVLDMSRVGFVDSSGLGAILSVLRELAAMGGDLKLSGVQKRVQMMFELVRMHRVLHIVATNEEAVAAFAERKKE